MTFQPKKCVFTANIGHCLVDGFKSGYYCGIDCKACTMGQFTVLWCTETPLRQDITPLYETKLAQLTKSRYKHLISTNL